MNIETKEHLQEGVWVIGDVHGEYEKLVTLLAKLPKNAQICFVGDVVDKGKQSSKVIDLIIKNDYLCVLGNHEIMMSQCSYPQDKNHDMWLMCGGQETLDSYEDGEISYEHYKWLTTLPYYYYFSFDGDSLPLVVSHSYIHNLWVDSSYRYTHKEAKDILWKKMDKEELFDSHQEHKNQIFNIFGHTPLSRVKLSNYYAMVDTGATYKKNETMGRLTALHYPSLELLSS